MKTAVSNLKFLFPIFYLTLFTNPAYAYLDPGTGSMLVQCLIGGVAVVISYLSIYWQKVKAFFSKEEANTDTDTDTDTHTDTADKD
jgi:hypothetical protein